MNTSKISTRNLLLLTIAINLALSFGMGALAVMLDYSLNSGFLVFKNTWEKFVMVVVAAPILETVLYQWFLVGIMLSLARRLRFLRYTGMVIVIPSILFGLSHDYNPGYMLVAFVMGLSMNTYYLIMNERSKWAVPLTMLVHAVNNLIIFVFQEISG